MIKRPMIVPGEAPMFMRQKEKRSREGAQRQKGREKNASEDKDDNFREEKWYR